jgi:hypothetical protein
MLIKAVVPFAGTDKKGIFSMGRGDIADIDEKSAASFVSAGYAEKVPEADENVTDGEKDETVGNNGRKSKKGSQN